MSHEMASNVKAWTTQACAAPRRLHPRYAARTPAAPPELPLPQLVLPEDSSAAGGGMRRRRLQLMQGGLTGDEDQYEDQYERSRDR